MAVGQGGVVTANGAGARPRSTRGVPRIGEEAQKQRTVHAYVRVRRSGVWEADGMRRGRGGREPERGQRGEQVWTSW